MDKGSTPAEDDKEIFLGNIKYSVVLKAISYDALKLNPAEQLKTRYLALHVPSNYGQGSETHDIQRKAFKKSWNSLSTKSSLVKPVAQNAD